MPLITPTPFIDRARELSILKNCVELTCENKEQYIFVCGEAGTGKSRLIAELELYAQSKGICILTGRCSPGALPFFPIIEAFQAGKLDYLLAPEAPPRLISAYLVANDGRLLAKYERQQSGLDPDIFTSMLTAVSSFVKDSIHQLTGDRMEDRTKGLRRLEYEDYEFRIERGEYANLVTVFLGDENKYLREDMKRIVADVNTKEEGVLRSWHGNMDDVAHLQNYLTPLFTSRKYEGEIDLTGIVHERDRLFERVAEGLTAFTAKMPLILFIDDMQCADGPTIQLINYLSRDRYNSRLMIIGAYRPEELDSAHPLNQLIDKMEQDRIGQRLFLAGFTRDETKKLAECMIENPVPDDFANALHDVTKGNPFFIVETIRALRDEKIIDVHDKRTIESIDASKLTFPRSVQEVILRRLSRLERTALEMLEWAAVIGPEFSAELLEQVTGMGPRALARNMRVLEQARIVQDLSHGAGERYQLDKLTAETVYNSLKERERREMHEIVGSTIEKLEPDAFPALAHHFSKSINYRNIERVRAEQVKKAIDYSIRAGEEATKSFAPDVALEYYKIALSLLALSEERVNERIDLLAKCSQLAKSLGNLNYTLELTEQLIALAEKYDRKDMIAFGLRNKAFILTERRQELESVIKYQTTALELYRTIGKDEDELITLVELGTTYRIKGNLKEARDCYTTVLRSAERLGNKGLLMSAMSGLAILEGDLGNYERAMEYFTKSTAIATELGRMDVRASLQNNLGVTLLNMGRLDVAIQYFLQSLETAETYKNLVQAAYSASNLADVYCRKAELDNAMKYTEKALRYATKMDMKRLAASAYTNYSSCFRLKKDWENAVSYQKKAIALAETFEDPNFLIDVYIDTATMYLDLYEKNEAEKYLKKGLHILESGPETSVLRRMELNEKLGALYYLAGSYDTSIKCYNEALELSNKLGAGLRSIELNRKLAQIYEKISRYDEALRYCNTSLELASTVAPENKLVFAAINNTYAWIYLRKGDFALALEYSERALKIAEQAHDDRNIALAYHIMGILHAEKGEYKFAAEIFDRSAEIRKKINDMYGLSETYNSIGVVHSRLGNMKKALYFHEKALQINEKIGEPFRIAASLYNIAGVKADLGDFGRALEGYTKALEISQKIGDRHRIAGCYTNMGCVYDEIDEFERALEYHNRALEIMKSIGHESALGVIYANIGKTYLDKGELEHAATFYAEALKISEKVGDKDIIATAASAMCRIFAIKGEKRVDYGEKALSIASETGPLLGKVHLNLGIANRYLRNWAEAKMHFENSIELFVKLGLEYELAKCYYEYGLLSADCGEKEKAENYFKRAWEIFEKLKLQKKSMCLSFIEKSGDDEIV